MTSKNTHHQFNLKEAFNEYNNNLICHTFIHPNASFE